MQNETRAAGRGMSAVRSLFSHQVKIQVAL
jgi:hypothetical protein